MEDLLIEVLEELSRPIIRQGSLPDDEEYPDSFFTFWNNTSYSEGFYDNKESKVVWDYDLNFYSHDPELTHTELQKAINGLKSRGFIATGKGYDVASDVNTHTGRGINIKYIET